MDDKTQVLTFPWMNERYLLTEETYKKWRSHSSSDCWYMTDSRVLVLNGISYYRDGIIIKDYNTEGGILSIIEGTWVDNDLYIEYRFFSDGRYEENTVYVRDNKLIFRTNVYSGQIEIVDDTHFNLW